MNNLSKDTDGAAVWRHHTEKSGYKAATFENNFAQSSQLAEKMLHFPFLPLQRIEVLSRVLGEPLMLLLSFKMEIPRKKLENRTFENILGGSH